MKEQFKEIELNPKDMLVKHLPDYFRKKEGEFDTSIEEHQNFDVGVIQSVGEELKEDRIGKVVYFHSSVSEKINLKGIGVFLKVSDNLKLLIRHDQDEFNY